MNKSVKILIVGSAGMVGSAILRTLISRGYDNIICTYHKKIPEKQNDVRYYQIDLMDSISCKRLFEEECPDHVYYAAAKVGGIVANNTYRAQFLYENMVIQNNIIHTSWLSNVKKLLFLGSSCIYPKKRSSTN